jgi:hypothetical protein
MNPLGLCFILLLEIYSDYRRTKKEGLNKIQQLTVADISKLVLEGKEYEGKEYEGIEMSAADIFEYWEPVVLLSPGQLFVLSLSCSNLIVASSRRFNSSLGPPLHEC